jgi:class 3 adenylate cyclase/tetratricopeptide (TPR) repeat protein
MDCSSCGQQNPEGFQFCGRCGAELNGAAPRRREERKVVSVLFCDLVGSTAAADSADPEDVSRALHLYHEVVRGEIERFAGEVEKFIGDAAVGVWGARVAHEDDAERAVRAALAIIEAVSVDVRVAVNTGEALVRLEPEVDLGEGLVGDVVNTASRMQNVAPVGGVVVGESTMRATADVVSYEPVEPVMLKGKALPVTLWRAVGVSADTGGRAVRMETTMIGRDTELALLTQILDRAVSGREFQLVTLIGEPGIGKSRLAAELARSTGDMRVRRGRCPAYGDGMGFWPLREILLAELGADEADPEAVVESKLATAVADMPDAPWLRARVAPLVGLPGEAGDREEAFTAWRRFIEELAATEPLLLIVEDVHWASAGMLDFLEHLVEWVDDVPAVMICTARPELLDVRQGWAGGKRNATTLSIRALSLDESTRLAHGLLERLGVDAALDATVVEQAGGNPLFVEEYTRVLRERGDGRSSLDIPDTIHALIAARVDTLERGRKRVLQAAAVVGKVFWSGAVAEVSGLGAADVRDALHELVRRELVRRARTSTLPGDEEYAFWHDLVHEVAYGQIPRMERASMHRRVGDWIRAQAASREADRAELIAYHYHQALTLATAVGEPGDAALRGAAVEAYATAASQALRLDPAHADALARRGVELASTHDPFRARLLVAAGTAAVLREEFATARDVLNEAKVAAEAESDAQSLAEAYFQESEAMYFQGDGSSTEGLFEEAIARLDRFPHTPAYAKLLTNASFVEAERGRRAAAEELGERALAMAQELEHSESIAVAIGMRGQLRWMRGDRGSLEDLQACADGLVDVASSLVPVGWFHVALAKCDFDGPAAGAEDFARSIDHAVRTGNTTYETMARAFTLPSLFDSGAWDELIDVANDVLARARNRLPILRASMLKALVLALRGQLSEARRQMAGIVDQAYEAVDPQYVVPAITIMAQIEELDGSHAEAASLLRRLRSTWIAGRSPERPTELARAFASADQADAIPLVLADLVKGSTRDEHASVTVSAILAESSGSLAEAERLYNQAADSWRTFGWPYELAHTLAGVARCSRDGASPAGAEAEAIFRGLGVVPIAQRLGPRPDRAGR